MTNNYINIEEIVPKERVIGSKRRFFRIEKLGNDKVNVHYDVIKGKGPKPFTLPERIVLDEKLAEAVGLYVGDGKLSKDLTHSEFTNKDSELAKFMFDFFLDLGVKLSDMTLTIKYRNGNEDRIKKWWANKIGIKPDKFKIGKSGRHRYSTLSIQVNGVVFRLFLGNLIQIVMDMLNEDRRMRIGFLRGLFAAEGCIAVKEGYINHMSIAFNPHTERERADFYRNLLLKENIKAQVKRNELIIRNWKDYYKLWGMEIFNLCYRKRERFIDIMRGMKIGCLLEDGFRKKLFDGFNLYQKDVAKIIGTYQASVCRMVKGEFLPTIEELIKASEFLNSEKFSVENIQKNIIRIRVGNLTFIDDFSEDFLKYLFELKTS